MSRAKFFAYKTKIAKDIAVVDEAISNGAFLSDYEWFDFNFKSALSKVLYVSSGKYRFFSRKKYKLAVESAKVFGEFIHSMNVGYSNSDAINLMKLFAKSFNSLMPKRMKVSSYDKNGILFINVSSKSGRIFAFQLSGINDFEKMFFDMMSYCSVNVDVGSDSKDFSNFLSSYFWDEYITIQNGEEPTPFVGYNRSNSLRYMIASKYSPEGNAKIYNIG